MAEWFTVSCLLRAARTVKGSRPQPPLMLADISAGTWIEKARLSCWPLYSQQVSHQRWILGIHCMQVTKHASERSTLALKPRGDVTRSSKQGYQWPREKDLSPPKIFFKKRVILQAMIAKYGRQNCKIEKLFYVLVLASFGFLGRHMCDEIHICESHQTHPNTRGRYISIASRSSQVRLEVGRCHEM